MESCTNVRIDQDRATDMVVAIRPLEKKDNRTPFEDTGTMWRGHTIRKSPNQDTARPTSSSLAAQEKSQRRKISQPTFPPDHLPSEQTGNKVKSVPDKVISTDEGQILSFSCPCCNTDLHLTLSMSVNGSCDMSQPKKSITGYQKVQVQNMASSAASDMRKVRRIDKTSEISKKHVTSQADNKDSPTLKEESRNTIRPAVDALRQLFSNEKPVMDAR